MIGKKAQVSTEYLIITGFILVVVTIIFTYSFVSNNQSIKTSQANNALDRMANAADLVYALGPENIKYIEVTLPRDTTVVQDITICNDGSNERVPFGGTACDDAGQGGAKAGGIELQLGLVGGAAKIARPTKAEVELDTGVPFPQGEGFYRIKVYWCDSASDKICLQRA